MSFPSGADWPEWQRDHRYGALVIEPPPEVAEVLNPIRERFDPVSADRASAHVTVTPPFVEGPTPAEESRVGSVVGRIGSMWLQLGTPEQFAGSSVIYLPVMNGEAVLRLRDVLLATGLFRLDLPHTTDFVPHLTISEMGATPEAALRTIIPAPAASAFHVAEIAWWVPDEAFRFTVHRTFALEANE